LNSQISIKKVASKSTALKSTISKSMILKSTVFKSASFKSVMSKTAKLAQKITISSSTFKSVLIADASDLTVQEDDESLSSDLFELTTKNMSFFHLQI